MTMAMDLIRHIAGLYSGKAFKGDLTQIYITGNEIWMAQQILASQQVEGAQGERETFEAVYSSLDLSMWDDAWGMPAYRHPHVDALWEGWQARAALAQPSPKCPVCKDSGIMGHSDLCVACAQPSPVPDQSEVQLGMAELERPDVVAWLVTGVHPNHSAPHAAVDRNGQSARALADHWAERGCAVEIMPLMTVAQHARAVAKWADLFDRAQDSADAARAKVPELERPEALDFKPCHHHAEKIRQRVEEAASVYEAGGSALGYMEDIAESALIVRNGLDELSAQHDRIVGALRAQYCANQHRTEWQNIALQAEQQRDAAQAQPDYPGATVADRLDAMADDCAPGSQRAADLRAAATVWRKHLAGPAAQPKRRPYNASGSLSEYGIFPECDAAPVAAQAPAANYRRVSYVCPVCAASLERQE